MSARRRRSAHPPMTAVAMPLDKLDLWLQGRTGAAATNLAMLDGFVTAVVAGPVSMDPPEWICPLLGIEVDAFNHGGTPEFAAISADQRQKNEPRPIGSESNVVHDRAVGVVALDFWDLGGKDDEC